jgi:2'-5' RNA ligase
MRYIIALLAVNLQLFTDEAQKQFASISQDYILSQNSLPHITLAQFDVDDSNGKLTELMWDDLVSQITSVPQPRFLGFGCTKKFKVFWNVSLSVACDPALVALHTQVLSVLEKYNLTCVSETGDLYRPHLTLARIKQLKIDSFNDALLEPHEFVLAFGQGDINGQFVKTIKVFVV